jgi:cytochrome d ubiquinol oxidase subunit I
MGHLAGLHCRAGGLDHPPKSAASPGTVYGVMRTAHSVTPSLTGFDVLLSLTGYMVVYLIMFPTGLWFLTRIVRGGVLPEEDTPVEAGRPAAPVKPVPERSP